MALPSPSPTLFPFSHSLATVRACSRRLQPRIYSTLFSSMTNTTDGIYLTPIFSYWMALPSPSPFSLPLLSLTYINRQQMAIHASRAAARQGRTQCDPLLLGEAIPKLHTVALSYPPPKIHTAGHPPFPIPQPHSPSGAQNQTMGN